RSEFLPGGAGFVADDRRKVVVAFAGTRDPSDWAFNLNLAWIKEGRGSVHQGFALRAQQVANDVESRVRRLRDRGQTIWLTGHSLGGAIATLAALRLKKKGLAPARTVTFGAPMVGDSDFAKSFALPLIRIEN